MTLENILMFHDIKMNTEFLQVVRAFRDTGVPFAVTGSWAIKLHAERLGLNPHRPPRDFDFSVRTFEPFVAALSKLGYRLDGFPRAGAKRVTLKKWPYEVDLLRAGGPLAPSLNRVNRYRNIPVATIRNMASQKQNILNTIANTKARRNLNFLVVLENFSAPRSR